MREQLTSLIENLKSKGILESENIENALKTVDRINFIPQHFKDHAYEDIALPLAEGQTISQPTTLVIMLELLDVKKGHKVLDVGAGSGWVSCLLGSLAGESGQVFAYEINETVGEIGQKNVEKEGCNNVRYEIAAAQDKWMEDAPYDRIHVAASFEKIPDELKRSLKVGGILVAPTRDGYVRKIVRVSEDKLNEERHYGFNFVPFVNG